MYIETETDIMNRRTIIWFSLRTPGMDFRSM